MDPDPQEYIIHNVVCLFVQVNEEGSEAAAATAGIMMLRSMPIPPPEIK